MQLLRILVMLKLLGPKPQVKKEVHKPHQESTPKRCFNSQRLGFFFFECPNQKVIALIKEDEAKEDVEEVVESNHVQDVIPQNMS